MYPPVIKHGVLEHGPFIKVIFLARNLHSVRGFSSQPCLMTPEGSRKMKPSRYISIYIYISIDVYMYMYIIYIYIYHLVFHCPELIIIDHRRRPRTLHSATQAGAQMAAVVEIRYPNMGPINEQSHLSILEYHP